ncbi:MAG: sulfite exporter TauE/SafE family protein [Thiohalocapsa sp. PB-PSB1]|nr:MAG: sulfite exporter TauE/SafE family protein [Thiohalocapsa sp. PB-PSB1]
MSFSSFFFFLRAGINYWRVFRWTAFIGLPFVMLCTRFAAAVPGKIMKPLVGGVIIAMILIALSRKAAPNVFEPRHLSPRLLLIGSLLMVPAAFYSGWISAGSGVFTTFIHRWLLRYDQLYATAMTLSANGIFWNGVRGTFFEYLGALCLLTITLTVFVNVVAWTRAPCRTSATRNRWAVPCVLPRLDFLGLIAQSGLDLAPGRGRSSDDQ